MLFPTSCSKYRGLGYLAKLSADREDQLWNANDNFFWLFSSENSKDHIWDLCPLQSMMFTLWIWKIKISSVKRKSGIQCCELQLSILTARTVSWCLPYIKKYETIPALRCRIPELQNQRIKESKNDRDHLVQFPWLSMYRQLLNILRSRHNLFGQPMPGLGHSHRKSIFWCSGRNFSVSVSATEKFSLFFTLPFRYLYTLIHIIHY